MKSQMLRRIVFIGKSMLWSLCLYIVLMLAFNWDEIKTASSNNSAIVINSNQQTDGTSNQSQIVKASISQHTGTFKNIAIIIKSICGLSATMGK